MTHDLAAGPLLPSAPSTDRRVEHRAAAGHDRLPARGHEHLAAPGRPRPAEHRVEPLLRRLVGAVLRERREDQGRTLRDVALDARVSVAYLSEIERGRKEASSEVLVAVCRALGLRLVDLVGAAHAELARADGRVVVDLADPRRGRTPALADEHAPERPTLVDLTTTGATVTAIRPRGTSGARGTVSDAVLLAA